MNTIEIEIKVKVANIKPLFTFLDENAQFYGETHQIDEYFTPAHRDFLATRPTKEWLRIRDAGEKCSINYKNWHFDNNGRSLYADEYETAIGDIKTVKKIFDALNLRSLIIVDKVRKVWIHQDYEIAVDAVQNLGNFVEIEYIGKKEGVDPQKITTEMVAFLKKLGCGKIERDYVGYPFLLLFKDTLTEKA